MLVGEATEEEVVVEERGLICYQKRTRRLQSNEVRPKRRSVSPTQTTRRRRRKS